MSTNSVASTPVTIATEVYESSAREDAEVHLLVVAITPLQAIRLLNIARELFATLPSEVTGFDCKLTVGGPDSDITDLWLLDSLYGDFVQGLDSNDLRDFDMTLSTALSDGWADIKFSVATHDNDAFDDRSVGLSHWGLAFSRGFESNNCTLCVYSKHAEFRGLLPLEELAGRIGATGLLVEELPDHG